MKQGATVASRDHMGLGFGGRLVLSALWHIMTPVCAQEFLHVFSGIGVR